MSVGLLVVGGAAALANSAGREIVLLLAPAVLTILITLTIQSTADAIALNVHHGKIQDMLNEHIVNPTTSRFTIR
jgi:low affinity Fe/Cu permease